MPRGRLLAPAVLAVVVAATAALALVVAAALASSARPPLASFTRSCPGEWECGQLDRFEAASMMIADLPGHIGMVIRDRATDAVWRAGEPTHPVWTASTIKLAMATDILRRARSGVITADAAVRRQIADMLAFSSNAAATQLWRRYGGRAQVDRFVLVFGMKGMHFPTSSRNWGAIKCTADDLAALMMYILEKMHPADRDYLVGAMRGVDPVQQWGVWAAPAALRPGVKDGWTVEFDAGGEHWVVNSVGFAGDDARYVVAVMYQLPPGVATAAGSMEAGVQAVSDLVATVFGAPVPAAVTIPPE